jgi:hypothetical protein
MKQPMFSIETDRHQGTRIVVARPDGTKVVIAGGQSQSTGSEDARSYPKLASFLERNPPQAH